MTRVELVGQISERCHFPRREVGKFLAVAIEAMRNALKDGEKVSLTSLGTIVVKERKARFTRHPKTGEKLEIRARRAISFKVSKGFRSALRG